MKFVLFGNIYQAKKSQYVLHLCHLLERRGVEIGMTSDFYRFLSEELHLKLPAITVVDDDNIEADLAISLGGDGTFLKAASLVGSQQIPILGINTGRLGFLADVLPDEMDEAFDEIFQGRYCTEERSVLQVTPQSGRLTLNPYGLNEIAVLKHDSSSMISIHTSINGEELTTYQADGLVVATPTGSTAYSLSVGGPIIVPHSRTFALTPVAPHSLNVRPLVIDDDAVISLRIESRSHNYLVSVDGRSESLCEKTELTVSKASYTVRVVKRENHHFFSTLRNKMMWGADVR